MRVSLITITRYSSSTWRRKSPSQRQRATRPPLPSHAANPFPSHNFAQAQTMSVTVYSYKTKGPPIAGRKGLIYRISVHSSVSHQQVFNKQQESIKIHPSDFIITLKICFIEAQIYKSMENSYVLCFFYTFMSKQLPSEGMHHGSARFTNPQWQL